MTAWCRSMMQPRLSTFSATMKALAGVLSSRGMPFEISDRYKVDYLDHYRSGAGEKGHFYLARKGTFLFGVDS